MLPHTWTAAKLRCRTVNVVLHCAKTRESIMKRINTQYLQTLSHNETAMWFKQQRQVGYTTSEDVSQTVSVIIAHDDFGCEADWQSNVARLTSLRSTTSYANIGQSLTLYTCSKRLGFDDKMKSASICWQNNRKCWHIIWSCRHSPTLLIIWLWW